jgi:transposase InsO family protein
MMAEDGKTRLTGVLATLGVASSSWYRPAVAADRRKRPGPAPKPIPLEVTRWVIAMARANPWYGYKRIAVMCRRAGQRVKNRQAYRVMSEAGLLHKPICRKAELYQAAKLFELLPDGPNDLWQMDVTYIHIPGHGWWYAITVIDYYSRYLLAAYLTSSYSAAEAIRALDLAQAEAQRLCGPLTKRPFLVTDNGPSFISRRFGAYLKDLFSHVRIRYRTPTQLGLLERFHRTLKAEEVYCKRRRKNVARGGRRKSVALWPLFCWIAYFGKNFPILHRPDRSNRSVHEYGRLDRDPPGGIGQWAFQKASLPSI